MVWYRNWPRYGLRWSGLCWHSRHSTSGAGRRAAACGRLHECCAGSGSTNHDSADRMSGQFLFYHENEAIHRYTTINPATIMTMSRHAETPWLTTSLWWWTDESVHRYSVRITDQCDVTIASGSHIDDVTIAELLTFEIISGAAKMNGMVFGYLRLREDSITNEQWYVAMVNITRGWIHVRDDRFSKFRNRKNLRSLESYGKRRHN